MEPANKSSVTPEAKRARHDTVIEFLPDADAIERLPLPAFIRSTVYVFAGALVCFVLWACFSQVEQVVVAQGRLITPLPNLVVQPLETSIIQKIEVRVGQVVRKGEVLATLDPTFASADESQLRARLQSLDTQTAGLSSELRGQLGRYGGKDPDRKLQAELAAERKANYEAQLAKMDNLGEDDFEALRQKRKMDLQKQVRQEQVTAESRVGEARARQRPPPRSRSTSRSRS
jgi:HlyD family secretion protein